MTQQTGEFMANNIIESMYQAFGDHEFYGLEYVLDEWREPAYIFNQQKIESFGYWDFRD